MGCVDTRGIPVTKKRKHRQLLGQNAEILDVKLGSTNKLPLCFKQLTIVTVACRRKMLPAAAAAEALLINTDLIIIIIIIITYLSEK
jgi:hypothetical protein